jgi:hypothetical protein
MQSVPTPNEEVVTASPVVPPTQDTVPVGLVGLAETAVLGAIRHGLPQLKRKISLVLKSGDSTNANDDIEVIKQGIHFLLNGTKVVMDISTCDVIGYLEKDELVKECNEYVKSICEKHNLQFKQ